MHVLSVTGTFDALPLTTQIIVSVVGIVSLGIIANVIAIKRPTDIKWVVAATVGGFFLVDLFYIHPAVWENVPALFYWIAKPIWVGVPMFVAAWWLTNNTDIPNLYILVASGISGIVVLQLYYTVIPIPIHEGPNIQIGLVENIVQGVPVHGLGLLVALAVVVVGMRLTDAPDG